MPLLVSAMAQDGLCWDRVSGLVRVFVFVLPVPGVEPGSVGSVSWVRFRFRGYGIQPESLILAQNERWRHA